MQPTLCRSSFTHAMYQSSANDMSPRFSAASVNSSMDRFQEMTHGAVNGTGGMSGAVMAFWRGANNMHQRLGNTTARDDLEKLGLHIFGKSEMDRAKVEVARYA